MERSCPSAEEALSRLNQMREEEGRGIERELRQRMARVQTAREEVASYRECGAARLMLKS